MKKAAVATESTTTSSSSSNPQRSTKRCVQFDASVVDTNRTNTARPKSSSSSSSSSLILNQSQLLNEQPNIDSALKSFASWWMAQQPLQRQQQSPPSLNSRTMSLPHIIISSSSRTPTSLLLSSSSSPSPFVSPSSSSNSSSSPAVTLKLVRRLSQTINAHVCAVQDTIGSVRRRLRRRGHPKENEKTAEKKDNVSDREQEEKEEEEEEEDDDDDVPDNTTDSGMIRMGALPSARYAASLQQDVLVAQTWNEIVMRMSSSSKTTHKPTKLLGRTSLQSVWRHLELFLPATVAAEKKSAKDDDNRDDDEWTIFYHFVQAFEQLLFADLMTNADARLVWSADGHGRAELARRAADRQQRAARHGPASEAEAAQVQQAEQDDVVDRNDDPYDEENDDEDEGMDGNQPPVTSAACQQLLEEFEQDHEEPL